MWDVCNVVCVWQGTTEDDDAAIMEWVPKPLDTASVRPTPVIKALVNHMARQMHEIWARDKIEDGWKYAPDRTHVRAQLCVVGVVFTVLVCVCVC